jgi:predicted HAD superfamily Cof-like phosphohydrolase
MSQHENSVLNTLAFFQKAVPDPQDKNFYTQLGVHCEEFAEMLDALMAYSDEATEILQEARSAVKELADKLKQGTSILLYPADRIEFLDAICDQMVTAIGTAYMAKMDVAGGFNEVNASNLSKFDENGNPIFNENMKIMKGPNYFKPDLKRFV